MIWNFLENFVITTGIYEQFNELTGLGATPNFGFNRWKSATTAHID